MAKDLIRSKGEGETMPDDLSGLRIKIKNRSELNAAEGQNNAKAYAKYLLYIKPTSRSKLFTHRVLLEIHRDMFGEVWSWAGKVRKTEKNLGAVPVKIGSEIDRLLYDLHHWETEKMESFEIAVRLHHRLVEIHPFENGNGRWARLVSNLYLRQKNVPIIEWPSDEKVIKETFKPKYLAALKKADHGDYKDLITLHRNLVR